MREASTNASQNENLKEKISIETNLIEESESETSIEVDFNLSESDKEKKESR